MFNIVPCKLCVLYSIMPWNVVRSAFGDTCYFCCLCNAHSKCCMAYVLKDYIPGEYEQKYTESTKRGTWGLSLLKRNKPEAMIWEFGVVCNTDNIADFDMAYTSTNKFAYRYHTFQLNNEHHIIHIPKRGIISLYYLSILDSNSYIHRKSCFARRWDHSRTWWNG